MAQGGNGKGCLGFLLKVIAILFVLSGILSIVMPDTAKKDQEEALSEATAFMDAGDYDAAISRLDEYWEEYAISNHADLADLYIQCFEAEERYEEAADIIISIFQEQGYEDPADKKLHTRLAEILPKLSQEKQDEIRKTLDELPDSLEEKEQLAEEKNSAEEAAKKAAETEVQQEAAEQTSTEPSEEEVIASTLYKTMYPVTLLFEYEENLIFRKGAALDILIDGEKIAELKQGEAPCYALILPQGEHKLKISSSFINSDSIKFTVGEDPYLGSVDNYIAAKLAFKNGDATISEFYTNRDAVSAEDAANAWLIVLEKSAKAVPLNDYETIMNLYYEKYDNQ